MTFVRAAVNFATSAAIFGAGYLIGKRNGEMGIQVTQLLDHHSLQMNAYRSLQDQFNEAIDLPDDLLEKIKGDVDKMQESFKLYLDSIDFTGSTKRLHDATNRELKKLILHINDLKKGKAAK